MKRKLTTILFLFFLFSQKNFVHAKTGNFKVGCYGYTSYVLNGKEALVDYYLFNSSDYDDKKNVILSKRANEIGYKFLNLDKVPVVTGINFGWSGHFSDKWGVVLNGSLGTGKVLSVKLKKNEYLNLRSVIGSSNEGSDSMEDEFWEYLTTKKVSVLDLGIGVGIKYDIIGSSLDFNDYARNSFVLSVNVGSKCDVLLSKDFLTYNINIAHKNIKEENTNNDKIKPADRINGFLPGCFLGVDCIWSWNFGIGVDICYFFSNLFKKNNDLAQKDSDLCRKNSMLKTPTYSKKCNMIQGGIRVFYDFGPFINNHEAPSEIDIEKW